MHPYPQMPPFTQDEQAAFLAEATVARLSSRNADGSIHTVPVLFRHDGRDIVIGTQLVTRKARNIERDPRVTVLIDNDAPPFKGVLVYGHAVLDEADPVGTRTWVFERYMPAADARRLAAGLANLYTPAVFRIRPERITSWDYSKDGFIGMALRSVD
jgi:PPOX class probable F420-dependent enzyme